MLQFPFIQFWLFVNCTVNDQAVFPGNYPKISIDSAHRDHVTCFPQFSDITDITDITVIKQYISEANLTMQKLFATVLVLQVTNIAYGAVPSFGRCPNVRG